MKHFDKKLHCREIALAVQQNSNVEIKVEDWCFLPLITSVLSEQCLVLCDETSFDDVSSSYDFLSNKNVFVPKEEEEVSFFSKTHYEEMFERSTFLVSFSLNKIKLFIVHAESLERPLFFEKKSDPFIVGGKSTNRESFLSFLNKNKYTRVEAVSQPGEYAVRGGVFDVFSYGSYFPMRAGFLGGSSDILFFNLSTGDVVKELSSAAVYPLAEKPSFSISDKISNEALSLRCSKNILNIYNPRAKSSSKKRIRFSIKSASYKNYKENTLKDSVFCSFLLTGGCEFNGVLFLPSWYSSGKAPVLKTKKIPLVGSLRYGDYYVHENYGVCQYVGSITDSEEDKKGFVSLKFRDGKMNLSVSLLNKIYFYAPSEAGCTLGGFNKSKQWNRQKTKAEARAKEFIGEVLSVYIKRESSIVMPYKKDSELLDLFLSEFPFLDTPDQASAWAEIQKDLCSEEPMHRLLCGDVGFGKTEIAMRAVFLSFINNKQSVIIAPTTILSQQLTFCFQNRFNSFGCKVGQVSRLTKRNVETFDAFINNKINILIGTHAIIKREDVLQKTSLLVVDEEHRFGVKDKEKIIKFSPACNFLSMSATPIPRTMQLALSGIRNISTLLSPPVERRPVITNVHSYNTGVIMNYLLKEFNRGGQVYFVDNSVENLKKLFLFFKNKLPNISSSFLYGGMDKKKINSTMEDFRTKKILFLFSTTIIESGIDVSSANTIIINNAQMFGLSQLHQLRGRVGRSGVQSYACLLVPKNKKLTTEGKARLLSIKKHSSLGSGYSLSLEDLQIRGSGNLFGYSQSGDSVVGFEYYSKILSKMMRLGSSSQNNQEPVIDLDSAYISSGLMDDEEQRVFYYKKISDSLTLESLEALYSETVLLFGVLPPEFVLLFDSKKLSFLAEQTPVVGIKKIKDSFIITVSSHVLKNISLFLEKVSSFFLSKEIAYSFSSNTSFLKIQFLYVKEDTYILLKDFIQKTHVK